MIFLFSIGSQTLAESGEEIIEQNKTIKEIKETLKDLNEDKTELSIESKILNKDEKLKSFFTNNLSKDQIKNIEIIILEYNSKRSYLNKILLEKAKKLEDTQEEKNLILEAKKELYKELTPYIDKNHLEEYLEYVKEDAKILKEKKEVTEQIIHHKEILTEKVSKIEEKIKAHRSVLNDKIKAVVTAKIDEKIQSLEDNEKFVELNTQLKVNVIAKTIWKVEEKIKNLRRSDTTSELLSKKLEVYRLLLGKLEAYHERLKKEYE